MVFVLLIIFLLIIIFLIHSINLNGIFAIKNKYHTKKGGAGRLPNVGNTCWMNSGIHYLKALYSDEIENIFVYYNKNHIPIINRIDDNKKTLLFLVSDKLKQSLISNSFTYMDIIDVNLKNKKIALLLLLYKIINRADNSSEDMKIFDLHLKNYYRSIMRNQNISSIFSLIYNKKIEDLNQSELNNLCIIINSCEEIYSAVIESDLNNLYECENKIIKIHKEQIKKIFSGNNPNLFSYKNYEFIINNYCNNETKYRVNGCYNFISQFHEKCNQSGTQLDSSEFVINLESIIEFLLLNMGVIPNYRCLSSIKQYILLDNGNYYAFIQKITNEPLEIDYCEKKNILNKLDNYLNLEIMTKKETTFNIHNKIDDNNIDLYTGEKIDWELNKDANIVKIGKQISISENPKLLNIGLKINNIGGMSQKIKIENTIIYNDQKYELIAIIQGGGIHGGHYVCIIKHSDNTFTMYSDSYSTPMGNIEGKIIDATRICYKIINSANINTDINNKFYEKEYFDNLPIPSDTTQLYKMPFLNSSPNLYSFSSSKKKRRKKKKNRKKKKKPKKKNWKKKKKIN
jgi:hypothetical protein